MIDNSVLTLQQQTLGISISVFEWTFVAVSINDFTCVLSVYSVHVSILCVPLIPGTSAYSSNQADVRDLFWMPGATAGQQQQQQQGEGMPSVRRPGQNDR